MNGTCVSPRPLDATSTPTPMRRRDVVLHELDGEAVVYDEAINTTYRLNGTAYFIWHACDGLTDAGAVARSLAERYDVPVEAVSEDVAKTLAGLLENGLLVAGKNE